MPTIRQSVVAIRLSDYPDQGTIAVSCDACGYRYAYDIAILKEHLGDVSMPDLLTLIAGDIACSRVDHDWYDRCKLVYDQALSTPSNHASHSARRQDRRTHK